MAVQFDFDGILEWRRKWESVGFAYKVAFAQIVRSLPKKSILYNAGIGNPGAYLAGMWHRPHFHILSPRSDTSRVKQPDFRPVGETATDSPIRLN